MCLDLVPCPDCGGWDSRCEGCMGRGFVPEADGVCEECGDRCEPGYSICVCCQVLSPYAIEVPSESIAAHEINWLLDPCVICGTLTAGGTCSEECRRKNERIVFAEASPYRPVDDDFWA